MRKLFGVALMVGVCVAYFFMVRADHDSVAIDNMVQTEQSEEMGQGGETPEGVMDEEISNVIKEAINTRLIELEEELKNNYPDSPRGVLAIHNELMQIAYNKSFNWNADIYRLVDLMRSVYAHELNYLNSYDVQVATMKDTLRKGVQAGEYLVYSNIKSIEEVDAYQAKAVVIHQMTSAKVTREYVFKKDEEWRIYSWNNVEMVQDGEEEVQ